jgi:hypothetical protein
MTISARAEALKAIDHAIERLADPATLAGLNHRLLVATLEHAREQVELIEETKRPRRKAADAPLKEETHHG